MTNLKMFAAWLIIAVILLSIGIGFGVFCMMTLQTGIVYGWTIFTIAAMLAFIKGYSEIKTIEATT